MGERGRHVGVRSPKGAARRWLVIDEVLLACPVEPSGTPGCRRSEDGQEAVTITRQLCPDVVVMDVEMPGMDGLAASEQIDREGMCPIVLVGTGAEQGAVRRARSLPAVQAYLVRPVSEQDLDPAIRLALGRFQRIAELRREKAKLEAILDIQSSLKRATDCLVAQYDCSRQEAHRRILYEARAKKGGLDQVARAVLAEQRVSSCRDVPV